MNGLVPFGGEPKKDFGLTRAFSALAAAGGTGSENLGPEAQRQLVRAALTVVLAGRFAQSQQLPKVEEMDLPSILDELERFVGAKMDAQKRSQLEADRRWLQPLRQWTDALLKGLRRSIQRQHRSLTEAELKRFETVKVRARGRLVDWDLTSSERLGPFAAATIVFVHDYVCDAEGIAPQAAANTPGGPAGPPAVPPIGGFPPLGDLPTDRPRHAPDPLDKPDGANGGLVRMTKALGWLVLVLLLVFVVLRYGSPFEREKPERPGWMAVDDDYDPFDPTFNPGRHVIFDGDQGIVYPER